MSTQHFNRPSIPYSGEVGLANRTLFQDISATRPRIPISSALVDAQINYLIDASNELFDTAIAGILPDGSVTLPKLELRSEGSLISSDGTDMVEVVKSGTPGYVLTENASGAPSFQAPVALAPGIGAPYFGSSAPTGWLLAQGQAISRSTYAALFVAIGTTYGVGDGSLTFNLPDMRGRTPVGIDNGAGRIVASWASSLGGTGGAELVPASIAVSTTVTGTVGSTVLNVTQIPSHTHDEGLPDSNNGNSLMYTGNGSSRSVNTSSTGGAGSGVTFKTFATGGGLGHDHTWTQGTVTSTPTPTATSVVQPGLATNWLVKI